MISAKRILGILAVAIILFILAVVGYNIVLKYLYPQRFSEHVNKYSSEYGVDKELIYAVIKCESNFKTDANSHAGAVGLMQLTEETFNDIGKMLDVDDKAFRIDAYDAETNIRYGTRYLKYLLEFFRGDKMAAIAAYNAGMGNVGKWKSANEPLELDDIRFEETLEYVKRVLDAEEYYSELY